MYMVLKDMKQIKEKIKSVENIKFSKHAEDKAKRRKIGKDLIAENLRNPKKLIKFSYEPDKYPGEKYELYFFLNKRKTLKIVVSFINEDLNVITTHIILSKRIKWVEKWQKKRR